MLHPIRVNLRSSRTSSRGFFAAWAVLSIVLMVLTCHSTKPVDLGKWGRMWSALLLPFMMMYAYLAIPLRSMMCCDVQWWHRTNWVSSSDKKGWPLSIKSKDSGPYWDISSSRHAHRDWAWTWLLPCTRRGTCWTSHRWVATPYPGGLGSLLECPVQGPSGISLGSIGRAQREVLCLMLMVHWLT